ncbi:MAG: response regulator, partial [Planctomycetes bacterium]|nr:response regulator [Planctomycetota bacterium]
MSTVSRRTLSPHQPRALAESNGVCGRLLVVDDNEDFLVALRMLLANTSHEVVCADDGLSALQQAERTEFDLLLTDVRMHPMDGVTLAGRVKEL